ncbi:DUF4397 domain-containing protein [Haladaptatus pallidirubidus]|uniref:DUF4397 domain-containing protein n=1 Tax=Haladaptatus pallidirubidus TaxID=1008152 RepID=UPI001D101DD4|nr:DUF4397 domain-containing protein [Haladaptatus pallidirubidus]
MRQTRRRVLRLVGASGLTALGRVSSAQDTTTTNGGNGGGREAARARIVHAVPGAPNVDVFVDGNRALQNVAYKDVSDYLELEPGQHTLQVAPAGEGQENAIIEQQATLEPNRDYTIAAGGTQDSPEAFLFMDVSEIPSGNRVSIRGVHLSPDAPAVDIATNGDLLVEGLEYGTASEYVDLPAGSYTIEVRPAGEDQAVATTDVTLKGGVVISAFAVGLLETDNQAQSLDLVTAVDSGDEGMTTETATSETMTTG